MVNWIKPAHSGNRVKVAGQHIREGTATLEDFAVLDNWRAAHAYIINTFNSSLRNRARGSDFVIGQRLKRRPTIVDKLRREPNMQLSTMHDIAGVRVIFPDIVSLLKFRAEQHLSKAKHSLLYPDGDKFNYITSPKATGYRGIHDVYKYNVSSVGGVYWNGLRIEIQYRTSSQHAWATAVETADLLTKGRAKFNEGSPEYRELWKIASEIISRTQEKMTSCLPDETGKDLVSRFEELDHHLGVVRLLRNAKRATPPLKKNTNTILIYSFDQEDALEVVFFPSTKAAIDAYSKLEAEYAGTADVVLVKAEDAESLSRVFQNYFSDTADFIELIDVGLKRLV